MNASMFLLVLTSVSLNALAQVVLRKGMLTAGALPPLSQFVALGLALLGNVWLWLGMLCYAASIGLWLAVLSKVPVSVAYPMLSIGYIIATVLGVLYLGESVGIARFAGILLICGGVVLISRTA